LNVNDASFTNVPPMQMRVMKCGKAAPELAATANISAFNIANVLEKFAAIQMIDVHLPTTDGRQIVLTRYTQPENELRLLLERLKLTLPPQPPPKTTSAACRRTSSRENPN
jgi:hypothetical protein